MSERTKHKAARSILNAYRRMLTGERLTSAQLADDWGERPRNTRLWMAVLEELEEVSSVRDGRHKALSVAPSQRLGFPIEPELGVVMALGRHILSPLEGTRFHRRFASLFEQIEELGGELGFIRRQWAKFVVCHAASHGHRAELEPLLDALLIALKDERRMSFEYTTFSGYTDRRVVDPLSLVLYGDELYLSARQQGRVRLFSLFSIRDARVLDETFCYPPLTEYDPGEVFTGLGIWPSDDNPAEQVSLLFEARMSTWVQRHRWHPSQRTRVRDDGRVQVDLLLPWSPEMKRFVLGFGDDVAVLAPTHARVEVRDALAAALDRYDQPPDPGGPLDHP